MLTTMFVAIACFAPETNLTADAIMQRVIEKDRKSTRLNSSHPRLSRMPSSA